MNRVHPVRVFPLLTVAALAACSGGGSTGGVKAGGEFIVLSTEPSDNATLFLNDSIRIDFSSAVDLDSVDLTTFSFQVLDQIGNTVAEPVAGTFALDASPGDDVVGRRLLFNPRLPTNNQFTNGGFRPGRSYIVQLVGGDRVTGTVIRSQSGQGLEQAVSFRFNTSDGTTPAQLFRNTAAGGPRLVAGGVAITPTPDQTGVILNKLGTRPVEVRLRFNQPLNPSSSNVPVDLDTDPLVRNNAERGRLFLQYDDPELGEGVWIPADVELESNTVDGSTVLLRPVGVLPNNADVQVIVESTLEDISGESNVSLGQSYDRQVAVFPTKAAFEQQFDGVVQDFLATSQIDTKAAFVEPTADVGPGYLKAGFAFEGTTTGADFNPQVPTTTLSTDFTQVIPANGAPFNVSGGVFNFRNVTIGQGKVVKGVGSNPMVWLVSGTFTVAGTLSVDGGDGTRVTTSGNAYLPKAGGVGACGGGDGGAGSPSATGRDEQGGTGNGPLQAPGQGGAGGALACETCTRGAGGGGGSFVTQGDPNFKKKATVPAAPLVFTIFPQQIGLGGNGCIGVAGAATRNVAGGAPGPTTFVDARNDNNFWGVGIRFDGGPLRITGELAAPTGGGGGGGGGDWAFNSSCNTEDPGFASDSSGGGGGGGGGALIVKALGPIIIAQSGRISADGGDGGGGEASSQSNRAGGGGGGAGGMVVLMSATSIDIAVKGAGTQWLYGGQAAPNEQNNYEFSISADGGACRTNAPLAAEKYRINNIAVVSATTNSYHTAYDAQPLGGFGGMGIVQLMAPPGSNTDNTPTALDDNINFYVGATLLTQVAPPPPLPAFLTKQNALAWRGYPNALGIGLGDNGLPINPQVVDNEGEIRPAPLLLPVPYGTKSRARSKWIDTGSTIRQALNNTQPRFITDPGGTLQGVRYEFAGLEPSTASAALGYASFLASGLAATVEYPTPVAATDILTVLPNSTFLGEPAYRVQLTAPVLGDADRYSQYEAEALTAGDALVGSFRILSHTDRELVLSPESGSFPTNAAKMRVRAKFFAVVTDGVEGLGSTYEGENQDRVPIANVRIGFAFHQNPANGAALRYPPAANTFTYELSDPAVQEAIRLQDMPFVQWDVVFDRAFRRGPADPPPALSPDTPRPELHFLRLPYRY